MIHEVFYRFPPVFILLSLLLSLSLILLLLLLLLLFLLFLSLLLLYKEHRRTTAQSCGKIFLLFISFRACQWAACKPGAESVHAVGSGNWELEGNLQKEG